MCLGSTRKKKQEKENKKEEKRFDGRNAEEPKER